jgi:aminobenzoyl-glutamate utilization protein B
MVYAAKALAATMVDLYKDPKTVDEIKREFAQDVKNSKFRSYIPAGPPLPPPSK